MWEKSCLFSHLLRWKGPGAYHSTGAISPVRSYQGSGWVRGPPARGCGVRNGSYRPVHQHTIPRPIPIAHLLMMRVGGGRGAAPPRRLATGMNPDRDMRHPETEIALGGCPTRPNYSRSSLPTSAREGENVERRSRQAREARHLPQHGHHFPRPLL